MIPVVICLLCARITMTRRGSRIRHARVGGDEKVPPEKGMFKRW
jgi:hypothetical protein